MQEFCRKRVPVLLCLMLLLSLFFVSPVMAQDDDEELEALSANRLSISPPIMDVTVKQGETVTQEVRMRFTSEKDERAAVKLSVKDVRREDGRILYMDELDLLDPSYSVTHWATVENDGNIVLPANEWVTAEITISIPLDAEMGEHVSVINVSSQPDEDVEGTGMSVVTSLSPAFYVMVTDPEGNVDINREWEIGDLVGGRWNGGDFTLGITNTGNVHLLSRGYYRIYDWWSNEMAYEKFLSYTNFLPDATKDLTLNWDNPSRLGFYRAEAELTLDGGETYETVDTWFVRIPTVIAIIILLVLVSVFVLIRLYLSRMKKKIIEEAKKADSKEVF